MTNLNGLQWEAIRYLNGPLLILAGAGSGKTKVITHKISYLMNDCGFNPAQIMAVTFTNKAAKEMKERTQSIMRKNHSKKLKISTFHTFGLNFIKQEYKACKLKSQISIFDTEDSLLLIKEILCQTLEEAKETLAIYLKHISHLKMQGLSVEQALQQAKTPFEINTAKLYEQYQKKLRIYNAVDFDDLILLPVTLLKEHPDIQERWQNKIRYILVDEYQDTNASQYTLLRLLAGIRGQFTVVGDDHQSIYTFRGAKPDNLIELQEDYPSLKVIKLEQNYRSTETILKAANHVIQHNTSLFAKNLWSAFGRGDLITIFSAQDETQEAERIVTEIMSHHLQYKTRYSDYAILYRNNHQSRNFEKVLREHNISYQVTGGVSFFNRTEVKDILAYLKIMTNPEDDAAFLRIVNTPKRELGPATIEKLSTYAAMRNCSLFEASFEVGLEHYLPKQPLQKLRQFVNWLTLVSDNAKQGDPMAVIQDLLKTINYENWVLEISNSIKSFERSMAYVKELLQWLQRLLQSTEGESKTLEEAVHSIILTDILERTDKETLSDGVKLMTLHASKGLEFPFVFLTGLTEETLPHRSSIEENLIEEERRLMYVGMTRAKKNLTLSFARNHRRFGEVIATVPSRFLKELPEDTIIWENSEEQQKEKSEQKRKQHLELIRNLLIQS